MEKIFNYVIVPFAIFFGVHMFFYLGISEYEWFIEQGLREEAASMLTFLFLAFGVVLTVIYLTKDKLK